MLSYDFTESESEFRSKWMSNQKKKCFGIGGRTLKYLKDDWIGEVMMSMTFKANQSEFFGEDTCRQCLMRSYIKPQCDVQL